MVTGRGVLYSEGSWGWIGRKPTKRFHTSDNGFVGFLYSVSLKSFILPRHPIQHSTGIEACIENKILSLQDAAWARKSEETFWEYFFGGRNQVLKVLSWPPLQQHWHSVAKEWRSRSDFNYQRSGKMFFPGSNGEWVQKRNIFKVSSQLDLKNSPFSFRMIKPIHGPDGAGMFYNGCCSCILNRIASMRFIMGGGERGEEPLRCMM